MTYLLIVQDLVGWGENKEGYTEREDLIKRLTELVTPIINDRGLELVEMQVAGGFRRPIVRVFIDREDRVTIDDCTAVSRRFALELDQAEVIETSYTLEVSSPGLDRPLVRPADFNRRRGCAVRVCLKDVKKPVTGTIVSADGELVLQTDTGHTKIAFDRVEKGLLEF